MGVRAGDKARGWKKRGVFLCPRCIDTAAGTGTSCGILTSSPGVSADGGRSLRPSSLCQRREWGALEPPPPARDGAWDPCTPGPGVDSGETLPLGAQFLLL